MYNGIAPKSNQKLMNIHEKLDSLPPHKITQNLNEILDNIEEIHYGWLCDEWIKIRGFNPEVKLRLILLKFLQSPDRNMNLELRLDGLCRKFEACRSKLLLGDAIEPATQVFISMKKEHDKNNNK